MHGRHVVGGACGPAGHAGAEGQQYVPPGTTRATIDVRPAGRRRSPQATGMLLCIYRPSPARARPRADALHRPRQRPRRDERTRAMQSERHDKEEAGRPQGTNGRTNVRARMHACLLGHRQGRTAYTYRRRPWPMAGSSPAGWSAGLQAAPAQGRFWRPGPAAAAASNRRHYSWCTAQHAGDAHVWEQHPDTDRFPVRQGFKFPGGVVALDRPICRHMTIDIHRYGGRVREQPYALCPPDPAAGPSHIAMPCHGSRHAALCPCPIRPAGREIFAITSLAIDRQDCHSGHLTVVVVPSSDTAGRPFSTQ